MSKAKKIGWLGRSEHKELHKVIAQDEEVIHTVYGYYGGGKGLLVSTTKRLLLIDKRAYFLNIEEYDYASINEFLDSSKFLQTTVVVKGAHSKLHFKSFSDAKLKELAAFVKRKIEMQPTVTELDKEKLNSMATFITKPYLNAGWPPRLRAQFNYRKRASKFTTTHS